MKVLHHGVSRLKELKCKKQKIRWVVEYFLGFRDITFTLHS